MPFAHGTKPITRSSATYLASPTSRVRNAGSEGWSRVRGHHAADFHRAFIPPSSGTTATRIITHSSTKSKPKRMGTHDALENNAKQPVSRCKFTSSLKFNFLETAVSASLVLPQW
jgi:hypothetical protein